MSHKLWIIERTMVFLLLLLTIGLRPVVPDKLTGTEIPPTVSFSGGTLEHLQLPLETFDIKVKDAKEIKYKGEKRTSEEFISHDDISQPLEEDALEKHKPNTTLNTEYNTIELNSSQNVAENNNYYRLRVNSGKSLIVLPLNSSQIEVTPQYKSNNISRFNNATSPKTNITKKPDSDYSYIFSKGTSSLRFDRHNPTTIRPNIYNTSHLRTKSKNTNEVIKRRNPFLNKIDANSKTLNRQNVISDAKFSHKFKTSNGIHREEIGTAKDGVKVKGSYSYVGDDGKTYTVMYTADENGFRPQGDHIPFLPEIVRKVSEQDSFYDDGSYDEAKYGHLNYENIFVRRAYKQDLRRNNRRRKYKLNQEENNVEGNENHTKNHNNINPKSNSVNSTYSDETKLSSTESNTALESTSNTKQTYTIRRKPRKFNLKNGFNKLYVENPESVGSPNNLKIYQHDYNSSSDERNKKALNEFSKTFATIGYIYGPPIKKFNAEEQQKNGANFKDDTDIQADRTTLNNKNTKNVKTNFNAKKPDIEQLKNLKLTQQTTDKYDKINNSLNIKTNPYDSRNINDDISNATSGKIKNTEPKTKFIAANKQPTHFLDSLENMKPHSNITDDISLLRKLFGLPNATKIEDFKKPIVSSLKQNVNDFKSLLSSPDAVVNEGTLNKSNVVNVEEVLKSIFGAGDNDKNAIVHNNIDKEVNQLNNTDESSNFSNNFKEIIINSSAEKIEKVDGNSNISEELNGKDALKGTNKGEDFSGPKQIPKFDPDTGYYYKK